MEHPLEAVDVELLAEDVCLPLPQPVRIPLPLLPVRAGLHPDVVAPVEPLEAPEGRRHALPLARQRVHQPAVVV